MSDALEELIVAFRDAEPGSMFPPAAGADVGSELIEARPDLHRERRTGVPEVIFASGKSAAQASWAARQMLQGSGRVLISRVDAELEALLRAEFAEHSVCVYPASRMGVIKRLDFHAPARGGCVGLLSAGTSDIPVAEEAAVVAAEMGCLVESAYDVGVAGLHRLVEPLRALKQARVDAIVVAAGMDGALPSVVCGLVDVPVIGLPTSVGYGLGGKGVAALLSMLQTCSPGLSVVNIDNGVGAGATAALIANRVAAARERG